MTIPSSGPVTFTDIQTEFGGSNPIALNEYYAGGTYVPAGTTGTYGAVPSSGQISVQNFYGTTAFTPIYIEEVFSTYLYKGNGTGQTITNGVNLSANGGLTWCKARSNPYDNYLFDTARGANNYLISNDTGAQNAYGTYSNLLTSFNTNGFSLGADSLGSINVNNVTYASWTFQEQPKFFDIVTYTGNATDRTVAHNLGSVPGCIIVKDTNVGGNWFVYHRGASASPQNVELRLNSTNGINTNATAWNNTAPTSTVFSLGTGSTNTNGVTYIAYLFAHDAGGFGAAGTDNVISCGSYTGDGGAGTTAITLGYEPQWILVKATSGSDNWGIFDNMRGLCVDNNASNDARLIPNAPNAESLMGAFEPTATGLKTTLFTNYNASGQTYVYVAIRRGPMKVPTVGTNVFAIASAVSTAPAFVSNAVVDAGFNTAINAGSLFFNQARLTGQDYLDTRSTAAAGSDSSRSWDYMKGMLNNQSTNPNNVGWMFGRAPSFMDVVCYTGTGNNPTNFSHNLAAVPELMILKKRSNTDRWEVYSAALGNTMRIDLNTDGAATTVSIWGGTPTTTQFSLTSNPNVNQNGQTYVAYLFATCAGVSKVGSYTGNGTTQTINCGFTGGARFVLIKRTDSTGGWYVYDTLRGMTALTDPYVLMNAPAAAQTDTLGSVTTVSTGFALNAAILAAINTNGASYIFLAIA
jgi:hypothetical protein